jgi:hypothetical protein
MRLDPEQGGAAPAVSGGERGEELREHFEGGGICTTVLKS